MLMNVLSTCVLIAALAVPQSRPDFSGTWEEDPSQTINLLTGKPIVQPNAPSSGGVMPIRVLETTITQTPEAITIVRRSSRGSTTYSFRQDGSENVNRNGAETHTSRARWEKDRFVIEGTSYSVTTAGESTYDVKQVLYLDSQGRLTIELTWGQDGTPTTSTRRLLVRKKTTAGY